MLIFINLLIVSHLLKFIIKKLLKTMLTRGNKNLPELTLLQTSNLELFILKFQFKLY